MVSHPILGTEAPTKRGEEIPWPWFGRLVDFSELNPWGRCHAWEDFLGVAATHPFEISFSHFLPVLKDGSLCSKVLAQAGSAELYYISEPLHARSKRCFAYLFLTKPLEPLHPRRSCKLYRFVGPSWFFFGVDRSREVKSDAVRTLVTWWAELGPVYRSPLGSQRRCDRRHRPAPRCSAQLEGLSRLFM